MPYAVGAANLGTAVQGRLCSASAGLAVFTGGFVMYDHSAADRGSRAHGWRAASALTPLFHCHAIGQQCYFV
jgi:hypothetical protein